MSLQYYLTAPSPCSYLPEAWSRSQVVLPTDAIDPVVYSQLVRHGFRRSGTYVYRPRCDQCDACVPVRLVVEAFLPSRSQRRCQRRNAGLTIKVMPLAFVDAHYRLYRRYQQARHTGGGMDHDDPEQYRNFILDSRVDSALIEFRQANAVVMVSLVDRLEDGLSAVYTFFDPAMARASLGVFGILSQIALCRQLGLPYLYLGYWIAGSRKMRYKADYSPLQAFQHSRWQAFTLKENPDG